MLLLASRLEVAFEQLPPHGIPLHELFGTYLPVFPPGEGVEEWIGCAVATPVTLFVTTILTGVHVSW